MGRTETGDEMSAGRDVASAKYLLMVLVLSALTVGGCASPWYERHGIESKDRLFDPQSVPNLILALDDKNHVIRLQAVRYLVRLGGYATDALPKLRDIVRNDPVLDVRIHAANAIDGIRRSDIK
jgi:hypothetical protein